MKLYLLKQLVHILSYLPNSLQNSLYQRAQWVQQRVQQPMNFTVMPGSCWLGYDIKNSTLIENVIPPNLKLTEIAVHPNIQPKKYLFFLISSG